MAFCTNCGASVSGAFCSNCGRAITSTEAGAPPRRGTSPWVWVLVILLGIVVVGGLATFAGGLFLVHKAREAGVDAELFRENPGLAIGKLIAAANPDAEVVRTDDGAGTVTLRDRRTGKEMTITFDQARKGNFRFEADGDDGGKIRLEAGGDGVNVLANVPRYPGAKVQASFEVDGNDKGDGGGAYEYGFLTQDAPAKVIAFYHQKLEEMGMKLALQNSTPDGGMLVAEDDANRRTLRVIVGRDSGGTTINVTARVKK
jgi:hypothetical protein